jgi:hypothetical protein
MSTYESIFVIANMIRVDMPYVASYISYDKVTGSDLCWNCSAGVLTGLCTSNYGDDGRRGWTHITLMTATELIWIPLSSTFSITLLTRVATYQY